MPENLHRELLVFLVFVPWFVTLTIVEGVCMLASEKDTSSVAGMYATVGKPKCI